MPDKFDRPATISQVSEDYLLAIGRVTSEWARLEWTINWEIRSLFVHPSVGPLRTNFLRKDFKSRVVFWREQAIKVVVDPKTQGKLLRIIERASQARDNRDWAVHGIVKSPLPDHIARDHGLPLSTRGSIGLVTFGDRSFQWKIRRMPIDLAWLNRLANKINHVHADLLHFATTDLAPLLQAHAPK